MSGTALDHRLVRDYLRELDAAMRGLPAAQARELKEQITAHLDDALEPAADDHEVAATLRPARLSSRPRRRGQSRGRSQRRGRGRERLVRAAARAEPRRVRWRLAAVVAVPTVIAAVLGALQISSDVSNDVTSGRVQHLAQLNAAVVTLTQKLEDERDLAAVYAAREDKGPLTRARTATDAAAGPCGGRGRRRRRLPAWHRQGPECPAGQPHGPGGHPQGGVVASQVIRLYTYNVIEPANTFSAAVGGGTGDASLQGTVTTLAALLGVENEHVGAASHRVRRAERATSRAGPP